MHLHPVHSYSTLIRDTFRKLSDGLFLTACRQVAKEYPNITYDEDLLDRVCLQVRFLHSTSVKVTLKYVLVDV